MKNNKGFSLIELLGVVVILGILMAIGVAAYTRYIDNSKNKAYKTLRESAISAMDNYLLEHSISEGEYITLHDLSESEYLERPVDPSSETKECKGYVKLLKENEGNGATLASNEYEVVICCANYIHTYNTATKKDIKNDKCALD